MRADIESLTIQLETLNEEYEQYLSQELRIEFNVAKWGEAHFFSSYYDFDWTPVYTLKKEELFTFTALCDYLADALDNVYATTLNYVNIVVNQNDTIRILCLYMSSASAAALADQHDPQFLKVLNTKAENDWYSIFAFVSQRPLTVQNPQTIRSKTDAYYVEKHVSEERSSGQSLAYKETPVLYTETQFFTNFRLLQQDRHYYSVGLDFRPATTPIMTNPAISNWWW